MRESVCTLEGEHNRVYVNGDCCPYLLNYQDFLSINSVLKELNCVSEAPLAVLEFEL